MINPITSIRAKCRDCHRCIRACPVKAISLRCGQARVMADLCISCGICAEVCPQKAKTIVSQADLVLDLLQGKEMVIASLAPSYPGGFQDLNPGQVVTALRRMGFARVEETATAAELVALHYRDHIEKSSSPLISSCCPVVVNLIEIYQPELIPLLSEVASPMMIHATRLKQQYPGCRVVFIGPCVAKIQEASRQAETGGVDAVLTFSQVAELWSRSGITSSDLSVGAADVETQSAMLYPLSHGILSSARLNSQELPECLTVSGLHACIQVFDEIAKGNTTARFIEALACRDGCIAGTGVETKRSVATRRARLLEHKQARLSQLGLNHHNEPLAKQCTKLPKQHFSVRAPRLRQPNETEIREILRQIGKHAPADESNCGGCGYPTCRDKAIATFQGRAELEMCVPYMRAKFESLSHLVVDSSLNAIIVVNKDLIIQQFNPAAERLFNPSGEKPRGKHLAAFIDPSDFLQVAETGETVRKRVDYPERGVCTSQVIYPLPEYGLVVGAITDITDAEAKKQELDKKHQATIERASQVIRNQMKLAQEIAGLLGEATAETKATLLDLIATLEDEGHLL